MKRILFIILGTLAVGLGIIGIFLPVFPQTPFFILAAFCYVRSSDKMYNWLLSRKFFGENVENYMKYRAMNKKAKKIMFFTIWIPVTISFIVFNQLYLRIILIVAGLAMTFMIHKIKTLEDVDIQEEDEETLINDKE